MKTPKHAGFSLVEITLALGIMAFAFVSIFGLLPIGMKTFRRAMDSSVGAQIAQRVIGDLQQTDFTELVKYDPSLPSTGTNGLKATRYFDDQGTELLAASVASAIYHVTSRVTPAIAVPQTGAAPAPNANLALVTVQVANNPGNQSLARDATTLLWTGAFSSSPANTGVVPFVTYPALIARNQ